MGKHTPKKDLTEKRLFGRYGHVTLAISLAIGLGFGAFGMLGKGKTEQPSRAASAEVTKAEATPTTDAVTPIAERPTTAPAETPSEPATPSIDAYRGLGTWVDIWDDPVFDRPEASVKAMRARGVRTIFVETSNSKMSYTIKRADRMKRLIRAAHGRDMQVVAWYLPDLRDPKKDYKRSKAAIAFKTSDGQTFDGFALDIESPDVKSVSKRNKRLLQLSNGLREFAGPEYTLGAIIPSPWGMKRANYWQPFPYKQLAEIYDVTLPMSYASYHGEGSKAAYKDTLNNMRVLRKQPGMANEPVHLVGGDADKSTGPETRAFVRGAKQSKGVIGASFYDYTTMRAYNWSAMKSVTEMR